MPGSTENGITFPTPGDYVKAAEFASKLAKDFETLALTADQAIVAGVAQGIIPVLSGYVKPKPIPSNSDILTLDTGWWYNRLTSVAGTMVNRPQGVTDGPFMVHMVRTPFGHSTVTYYGYSGTAGGVFENHTGNAAHTAWVGWRRLDGTTGGGITQGSGLAGFANILRTQMFRDAMGPVVTGNKGAIAFRFDHGLSKFNSIIRPLLEARGIKYSLALSSRNFSTGENAGVSASMVNGWVGAEVWNHGANQHQDESSVAGLTDQIVTGLAELQAALPDKQIWGYAVPGTGGSGQGGFFGGATAEQFYETAAGDLILTNHAVSSGSMSGTSRRPLDGRVRQGMAHFTIEAQTVGRIKSEIDNAILNKTGNQLMMHPNLLNTEGYLTTAQLVEVLDYVVAKRDAGTLAVLSPYEMVVAQLSTSGGGTVPGPPGAGVPAGGEALQVIRKNAFNTTTEWATLTKSLVGLSNVDNTSDIGKPVSLAQKLALDEKADKAELETKADLVGGKVPASQIPADALVTDANVAATVNGTQTGAAIDQRINTQVTPVVQQITADYVASDQAVIDAAAAAVNASPALAEKMPLSQGQIPAGGNANNYNRRQHSGPWGVASAADAATIANLPVALAGTLIVNWIAGAVATGGHQVSQFYIASGNGGFYYRAVVSSSSGTWSAWVRLDKPTEAAPAKLVEVGANLDDYRGNNYRGPHYIPSTAVAKSVIGLPAGVESIANLNVLTGPPGYSYTTHLLFTAGAGAAFYWRTMLTGSAFSEWSKVGAGGGGGAGDPFEPVATGMNNADLLAVMEQRKGGSIGTSGRAGFALRVDHGTTAFRNTLGPLLKKYGIPVTMAVYSEQREISPVENGVNWAEVESWHHSHGMSFGNHSNDHLDKPGAEGWQGGTIGSLAALKTVMPSVPVEQYIPHGSVGYDRYGGFNQANSHEAIVGTLAGRMALSSHALIAGYRGGRYRPLHGKPMQGLTHWSMEESTPAVFKSMVDGAINRGAGLAVMFHPEFIGLTGKMTWAQVEECLAYVAQKRDEGLILPLTLDGLAFADMRSDYRDDLIDKTEALMQDGSKIYGNFTETPGAFTSSTPGQYVRHLPTLANRDWALGGTRCAEWKVSSTAGSTVTVTAQESSDTPGWAATRTVTVPVGESVVYLPCGIPLDASGEVRVELTLDSGDLTVNEAHLYSA